VKVWLVLLLPLPDFQVPVIGEALLIETLDSAVMDNVAPVTSSAVRLERNVLDGCSGLPLGHNTGLTQQALVVAGTSPALPCFELP